VLQKSFSGDERNFLGPLMRFARGDVKDPHRLPNGLDRPFPSGASIVAMGEEVAPKSGAAVKLAGHKSSHIHEVAH
jgi:hypothetical protein